MKSLCIGMLFQTNGSGSDQVRYRIGVGCETSAQSDALRVCGDAVTPARQESTDETCPPLEQERAQNFQAPSAPLTTWPGTAERLVFTPPPRFASQIARESRVPEALFKRNRVDVPGKRGFVPEALARTGIEA